MHFTGKSVLYFQMLMRALHVLSCHITPGVKSLRLTSTTFSKQPVSTPNVTLHIEQMLRESYMMAAT